MFTENDAKAEEEKVAEIKKKMDLKREDRVYSDALFVTSVCWMKTEPL